MSGLLELRRSSGEPLSPAGDPVPGVDARAVESTAPRVHGRTAQAARHTFCPGTHSPGTTMVVKPRDGMQIAGVGRSSTKFKECR